ncbi:MAG TPA: fumarate/nitrate reduction transcriptional regulator Fnr [Telluria sp.]|nr:fumarate/nitrate reduction transcriptional regulator Fnr [Telluria sp.]
MISSTTTTNKCAACGFQSMCLAGGLDDSNLGKMDDMVGRRRRVARDERLYRLGQPFTHLYAVHFGHFKTVQVDRRGQQQITGFMMAGELLGMDAIASARHASDAVALEDSEVCEIPFARLEQMLVEQPELLKHFHRLMSQEILREQSMMLSLGNMRAEQRLAMFLQNLASRYAARGYSGSRFQLRMSREDIGGYLGLTIESISRLLARFRKNGWIKLDNRDIELLDRTSLEALAAGLTVETEAATDMAPAMQKRSSHVIPIRAAA